MFINQHLNTSINRFLGRLSLVIVALLFSMSANSQYFKFTNRQNKVTTAFKLVNNLVVIPLMLNGKGPFNFIVDTGVGILLITEPTIIDSLAPTSYREIIINGIGEGNEMRAYIHPMVKVDVTNSINGSMPVAILQKEAFNLSSYAGMPIHGLIGYELFSSFIVQINYSAKVIKYHKHETAFIPRKGSKIPISIEDRKPYVTSDIVLENGIRKKVKLIIDSGAGHPLSLETEDGIPYIVPETNIAANLGVGLSGLINGFIARIPQIKLGKFQMNNVICAFPNYNDVAAKVPTISRNGSMGNNILKRFNVVFDYAREAMYLKPNAIFREPFEHDMSGMEIASEGRNFEGIVIVRVEKNSAAAKAGLKAEDRILSVNFKKVLELGTEQIHAMFKSRDDRGIILEILPDGSADSKFVVLVLKQRI